MHNMARTWLVTLYIRTNWFWQSSFRILIKIPMRKQIASRNTVWNGIILSLPHSKLASMNSVTRTLISSKGAGYHPSIQLKIACQTTIKWTTKSIAKHANSTKVNSGAFPACKSVFSLTQLLWYRNQSDRLRRTFTRKHWFECKTFEEIA
jgi:hypothetical protein